MGLLVDSECYQILMASAKLRDTLVSWLGILWHDELERGFVQVADSDVFMRKVCDLRGILASLADMPDMQTSGPQSFSGTKRARQGFRKGEFSKF